MIKSVAEAALSGEPLQVLIALRHRVAQAIDDTPPTSPSTLGMLVGQLRQVELAIINTVDREVNNAPPIDDTAEQLDAARKAYQAKLVR